MALKTRILLHDIRSAYNVGSIFRTAEGAGVSELIVSGHTPAPVDRFGRARRDIAKTALGAELILPWRYVNNPEDVFTECRTQGITTVAVEQCETARDYRAFRATGEVLFVFGNEVEGLPQEVIDACDYSVEIPMRGRKESLNVSVAVGVVLFHFARG